MNMTSSSLQFEVAYWPAMMLGGAAQVVAAHCPNKRTLDPAVCSYNQPTYAPASRTMAFTLQCVLVDIRSDLIKCLLIYMVISSVSSFSNYLIGRSQIPKNSYTDLWRICTKGCLLCTCFLGCLLLFTSFLCHFAHSKCTKVAWWCSG